MIMMQATIPIKVKSLDAHDSPRAYGSRTKHTTKTCIPATKISMTETANKDFLAVHLLARLGRAAMLLKFRVISPRVVLDLTPADSAKQAKELWLYL